MDTSVSLHRWRILANAVWAIIGILLLVAASGWVLGRIMGALAPFVLAFLVVFLSQGFVEGLARRGVRRDLAVAACFAVGFVVASIGMVFLLPPVTRQIIEFAGVVPQYLDSAQGILDQLQQRFSDVVIPQWLKAAAESIAASLSQVALDMGDSLARGIVSAGSGIAVTLIDLFLALVIAFWVLKDLPTIRVELSALVGEKYESDLENLLSTLSRVVGGYLKGQTIASVVTALIVVVGLAVLGVPYSLVIGVIALIFNYVPYVGPFLTGLVAAVVALFVSPVTALVAIAIVFGAQQVTDLFVTPRVMSEQVDLHPTLVIFSLLVGGTLFGFWGMIFAIPVAATAKGLFVYYYERRTDRTLASEDGALFRSVPCDDGSEDDSSTVDGSLPDDSAGTSGQGSE